MNSLDDAEANLRTIRQLMERATTYRAISGPVALVAGLLATLNWIYFTFIYETTSIQVLKHWEYSWYGILGIVIVVNTALLGRISHQRGENLFNPRTRMALGAFSPPLIAGFLIGLSPELEWLSVEYLWLLCYGLAICATFPFSPKSMKILGGSIVALAILFWTNGNVFAERLQEASGLVIYPEKTAMFIGFGLTHLFYAACVPWKIAPDD